MSEKSWQRDDALLSIPKISDEDKQIYMESIDSILFFSDYFVPHRKEVDGVVYETPFFHEEIREMCKNPEGDHLNVIVPRLHAKTTALKVFVLWAICFKFTSKILYLANEGLWELFVSDILFELENNEEIVRIFWQLAPKDKKWQNKSLKKRSRHIETTTGVMLIALSKGQKIRWRRAWLLIVDDPEEEHEVDRKEKVEKFRKRFFWPLFNVLYPTAKCIVLGTILSNYCLVKYLKEEKKWATVFYKAVEDWQPIRPEMRPLDLQEKRKHDIWSKLFNQEFFHIPIDKSERVIQEYWMRYRTGKQQKNRDYKMMIVDPAEREKEKNDFSWIHVKGVIGDEHYSIYTKGVKLSPLKLEAFCIMVYQKFSPDVVVIETNRGERLAESLKAKWIHVEKIDTTKDKYTRLVKNSPVFENGKYFFLQEGDENVVSQITNYPDVEHDDEMDAVILGLESKKFKRNLILSIKTK